MTEAVSVKKSDFDVHSLEDEIRVDALCCDLLRAFYRYLLDKNIPPVESTALTSGADYFTRDFVIAYKQKNILDIPPGTIRQFSGNWYITNTLEPNIRELSGYLAGVKEFYGFLNECGIISKQIMPSILQECDDHEFYEGRIQSFWEIHGDGYFAWERECTLKDD